MFLEIASWNPYHTNKWAEDERFGPTYYTQIEEMRAVQQGTEQLTPRQQQRLALQLADVLRESDNPLLRREAVKTLAVLATPAAVEPLREAITDPDSQVRTAACVAWGKRGGPEAVSLLGGVIGSDQNQDVRLVATRQLGRFSDPTAVQALGLALNDSDPAIQFRAVQSLKSATQRDYGDNVLAWRQYLDGGTPQAQPASLVERVINATRR